MSWNTDLQGKALIIAQTDDSPLRVMAGPGTGKSFAMKRRVARLLENEADPRRILAVTFTRTAASMLVSDLRALGVPGCESIGCGTLHSFCFRLLSRQDVLQQLGRNPRPLITFADKGVAQFEASPLLADIMRLGRFETKRDCTKRIRAFEAAWARQQDQQPGWPQNGTDREFHRNLINWLIFHKAMLIGELVPEALRFIKSNPANAVHTAYDHIIVDEYQDLNKAEQELLDVLAHNGALALVGDEDQSIYSFRFANPEGIRDFHITHNGTHDETLDECRRCPKLVVNMADSLIRNNHPTDATCRLQAMTGKPDGEVRIVQWNSIDDEVQGLAAFVKYLIDNRGYQPAEILILTPRRLIGYRIRDELRNLAVQTHSFYHEESLEDRNAQEAFCLLTQLVDSEDRPSLRWWLGYGSPTWNATAYSKLRIYCENNGVSLREALEQLSAATVRVNGTRTLVQRFSELRQRLAILQPLAIPDLINNLFPDEVDWAKALREAALLTIDTSSTASEMFEFLKTGITQPEMPPEGDFVRVMSLHKSKGLTSRAVTVADCLQGLIPGVKPNATDVEQRHLLEEQRRLFYVAITRCTEHLVISSSTYLDLSMAYQLGATVRRRGRLGLAMASPFIAELGNSAPTGLNGNAWRENQFQ